MDGIGGSGITPLELAQNLLQTGQQAMKERADDGRIDPKEWILIVEMFVQKNADDAEGEVEEILGMAANLIGLAARFVPGDTLEP